MQTTWISKHRHPPYTNTIRTTDTTISRCAHTGFRKRTSLWEELSIYLLERVLIDDPCGALLEQTNHK